MAAVMNWQESKSWWSLSNDDKNRLRSRIQELRQEGFMVRSIAKWLGITRLVVRDCLHEILTSEIMDS
jgi:hypothetical protein